MKQAVMGIGLIFTLLLTVGSIMGLGTERAKSDELNEVVSKLVFQSLEEYRLTGQDLERIVEDNAAYLIDDGSIRYRVMEINEDLGFLEIEGTMEYSNFGKSRTIVTTRAALIDKEK